MKVKIELKNFELRKLSRNAKKGLVAEFYDLSSTNELWSVDSDGQPHEDFEKAVDSLKEVLAYSLGLNNGWDFSREHNRKNDEVLKKAKLFWDEQVKSCVVKGFTLVGSDDNEGLKIAGSLQTDLGVVGLASPIIKFEDFIQNSIDEDIMIGDLAETAYENIKLEAWKYIFSGRRGGELFDGNGEPNDEIVEAKMQKVV